VVTLDDCVDDGEPHPDPRPHALGRVEGFEDPLECLPLHAASRVREGELHVVPGLHARVSAAEGLVEPDVARSDDDLPAVGHGILRVDPQVEQGVFELHRVAVDGVQVRGQSKLRRNRFGDGPGQRLLGLAHHLVEIEGLQAALLAAAENQQLLGERRRPLDGALDLQQPSLLRAVPVSAHHEQLDVARDALQMVVEVVGDPAGKRPDGLHLPGVLQPGFEMGLPRHVPQQTQRRGAFLPGDGNGAHLGLELLTSLAERPKGQRSFDVGPGEDLAVPAEHALTVFRTDEVRDGHGVQFLRRESHELRHRRVGNFHATVLGDKDPVADLLHDEPVALLGILQCPREGRELLLHLLEVTDALAERRDLPEAWILSGPCHRITPPVLACRPGLPAPGSASTSSGAPG